MQHSPSLEAGRSSASQEFPAFYDTRKVQYRIYKRPSPVPYSEQHKSSPRLPILLLEVPF
jgi:hypothetical protein